MTTRAFLAAILGGIAMFIWSFIAHDLLPLGEMGMREFKDEAAVLDALKTNLGDARGLYHFPGHRAGPNATRQEKSDAMKRAMELVDGRGDTLGDRQVQCVLRLRAVDRDDLHRPAPFDNDLIAHGRHRSLQRVAAEEAAQRRRTQRLAE